MAPKAFTKPPRTFEQQADLLLSRGMLGDRNEIIQRLSTVNYYRLSAYWFTFRMWNADRTRSDNLRPGTSFGEVWDRYVFDQRLRLLVMDVVERIEVAVRTRLAYHHAHAFGAAAYADNPSSLARMPAMPTYAGDTRNHYKWIERVRAQVERSRDHPFVRHFRSTYALSPDLPIWMAVELMTFGDVVSMYQGCPDPQRQLVADVFGVTISELESWLLMLLNVRNICAHHGRLWNRKLVKLPKIPRTAAWASPVKIDPTTVFAALTICAYVVGRVWPDSTWCQKFGALMAEYSHIPKRPTATQDWSMGMPDNWLDCPLWAHARPAAPAPAPPASTPVSSAAAVPPAGPTGGPPLP